MTDVLEDLGYSKHFLRFVRAHQEAFLSAYYAPSPQTSSHELARLRREYETLPPRHTCSCPRLNPRTGSMQYHCLECQRAGEPISRQSIPLEPASHRPIQSGTVPLCVVLDMRAGYAA